VGLCTRLIAIGEDAVTALLRAIIDRASSGVIVEGAHHVMHEFSRTEWGKFLSPVYEALDGPEPAVSAPVASEKALQQFEYSELTK